MNIRKKSVSSKQVLASLKSDHETECQQIREQTKADAEAKVDNAIQQYRELTNKNPNGFDTSVRVFEPVSRLSVHIAEQLVRGELTVGPVAITRLVQGCLDAIEERIEKRANLEDASSRFGDVLKRF